MHTSYNRYYLFPSIYNNSVVFTSDDDIWSVSTEGGVARKLTSGLGRSLHPTISPDGSQIAYVGNHSGQDDIYVMPAQGGISQRLTYKGNIRICGWFDSLTLLVCSTFESHHFGTKFVYKLTVSTRKLEKINVGPAMTVSYSSQKAVLLGRYNGDSARWKRYKGGTAGVVWVDGLGNGNYTRILKDISTNIANPMWIGEKIFFISDHQGIANIYSCNHQGKNITKHTNSKEFYVRNMKTDGKSIVYQCGGDLYKYDLKKQKSNKINVEVRSDFVQTKPRFVSSSKYLSDFNLDSTGKRLSIITRGKPFVMEMWDKAPFALGDKNETRYKHTVWLKDNNRLLTVAMLPDGEEELRIITPGLDKFTSIKSKIVLGKVWSITRCPGKDLFAITNHKNELWLFNPANGSNQLIERNEWGRCDNVSWSPDGNYLAYNASIDMQRIAIRIYNCKTKKLRNLLTPISADSNPVFDPNGKYLYFVGVREFQACDNETHFDFNFAFATRPYAVVLDKKSPSPFLAHLVEEQKEEGEKVSKLKKTTATIIDFDQIEQRVLPFDMGLGGYEQVGAANSKLFFIKSQVGPAKQEFSSDDNSCSGTCLYSFDFKENKASILSEKANQFKLSADGQKILVSDEGKLRLISTSSEPSSGAGYNCKDGWIDLSRIKVKVDPVKEWKQMYHEAWILQREHFWTKDMSKVDWKKVYKRYHPLLDRISTRSEFSDLMWEMQGELGTSHCYEGWGDYHREPPYNLVGKLGMQAKYISRYKAFEIEKIVQGDSWIEGTDSPLNGAGVSLAKGDKIVAVDGQRFSGHQSLDELLENKASVKVNLTVKRKNAAKEEVVCLKPMASEQPLRYRAWVESNKNKVHKEGKGQLGYLHIPDMGVKGYGEFYRHYLTESKYPGLIVDVRANGGGFVSQLILRMLKQRIIGYDLTRWNNLLSYPMYTVSGPIVAIADEMAGSDGDMFSHAFKLLKLGKLIGKRTWGGVIGINFQYSLKDGTYTTQPEYSSWFKDVGFNLENYGADPDIEVEITPKDHKLGKDTQLDRAIKEALADLKKNPPLKPDFNKRPDLSLP